MAFLSLFVVVFLFLSLFLLVTVSAQSLPAPVQAAFGEYPLINLDYALSAYVNAPAVLLANLALSGVVEWDSIGNNGGGVFEFIPLTTSPVDSTSPYRTLLLPVNCPASPTGAQVNCVPIGVNSVASPLSSQLFALGTANIPNCAQAYMNIWGGFQATNPGNSVLSFCANVPIQSNEVFYFMPLAVSGTYLLQAYNTQNGILCVVAQSSSSASFVLQTCDATNANHVWVIYDPRVSLPESPPYADSSTYNANHIQLSALNRPWTAYLYSLGGMGILNWNNPGSNGAGGFSLTELLTAVQNSYIDIVVLTAVTCPVSSTQVTCSLTGWPSSTPLNQQLFAIQTFNFGGNWWSCATSLILNIWGGFETTNVGSSVYAFCSGGIITSNEVFYFQPINDYQLDLYLIQAYNTQNGALCVTVPPNVLSLTVQGWVLEPCNSANMNQVFAIYQQAQ